MHIIFIVALALFAGVAALGAYGSFRWRTGTQELRARGGARPYWRGQIAEIEYKSVE